MKIDVAKAIQELLFEHNTVVVPGLGGFVSLENPSIVDYLHGTVLPPSKKLKFNPAMTFNDGVLIQYLQEQEAIGSQEAGEVVDRYVEEIRRALERQETIEIAQVGRLYQDFEHKVNFLPEDHNFNADSFGLPAVKFTPLGKERIKETPAPAPVVAAPVTATPAAAQETGDSNPADHLFDNDSQQTPVATGSNGWLQKALPWMVLLLAILAAGVIYLALSDHSGGDLPIVDTDRVNVKPQVEGEDPTESEQSTTSLDQPSIPSVPEVDKNENVAPPIVEKNIPDDADTESGRLEPGKEMMFMVVHSFGVKANATKFVRRLSEAGYSPETKQAANLYRVGVVFPYSNQSEVEAMRKELARKFDAGPKTEQELEEQGQ